MGTTTVTCSWCHTPGAEGGTCQGCGHDVGVPRLDCRCPQCQGTTAPDNPDVADLLRALNLSD